MKSLFLHITLILLAFSFSNAIHAQVKTSVTFSNPYIKQIKKANKTRKEYKKYLKDSVRKIKIKNKYYDSKIDSVWQTYKKNDSMNIDNRDSLKNNGKAFSDSMYVNLKHRFKSLSNNKLGEYDSLKEFKEDSLSIVQGIYNSGSNSIKHEFDSLNGYGNNYKDSLNNNAKNLYRSNYIKNNYDSLRKNISDSSYRKDQFKYYSDSYLKNTTIDSSYLYAFNQFDTLDYKNFVKSQDSIRSLNQLVIKEVESQTAGLMGINHLNSRKSPTTPLENEFGKLDSNAGSNLNGGLPSSQQESSGFKNRINGYRDKKNLKSNLKQLSNSKLITQNTKINNAHKSLDKLKKKYLTLPSSGDLSSGVKRNSLKGQEFKQRLVFGGSIRIRQTKSIDIDFSPSMAYLINKHLSSGIAVIYRGKFGNGNRWHDSFNTKTYGGRIFTDYSLIKSFYAHAEFESITTPAVSTATQDNSRQEMVLGAMAGMGRKFNIGKGVVGKAIIQYNFLYKKSTLYSSPWVVRFGFELKNKKKNKNN